MTLDEIRAKVAEIADMTKGNSGHEEAHEMEDALYLEVLKDIASGCNGLCPEKAQAALEVSKLKFYRWYA